MSMIMTKDQFKKDFVEKLETKLGRSVEDATPGDCYYALGSLVREYAGRNWLNTTRGYRDHPVRQVYYFSMEFLLGRLMANNLQNLGIYPICKEALAELGFDLDDVLEQEPDAGLGNGGLGRLAACFLDSLASLQYPGHGCGIRYKYGLFEQKIVDGYQVEMPDYWLKKEYVWEIRRADRAVEVRFGGEVIPREEGGRLVFEHRDYETVLAVPYDVPVIGYGNKTVNTLRLWSAEPAPHNYRFHGANDYYNILDYNRTLELISGFLYPDDSSEEGRLLRLKQQYFLVSAGLQGILNHFRKRKHAPLTELPRYVALHINDTHPTLIIPELMRILMDEEGLGWDEAWHIVTQTVSYTNHTIMSEALEKWPVGMVRKTLPRIFMIIEEINERFCRELFERHHLDLDRIAEMAIIAYGEIRMAHLAIAGSCSVNGVARLHTEILKKQVMRNFHDICPHKFSNKTNGITHRRWLLNANPGLAALITESIGSRWIGQPKELLGIIKYSADPGFQEKIRAIKQKNKQALARLLREKKGIAVDGDSIFDVQIKRIHGYKRQLLNAMHILDLYLRLKDNPGLDIVPRTFIIGGKAAPAYHFAKRVIKLFNTLADVINNDPAIRGKMKVVFMENYSVTLAEKIIPAADVSEQISTAGKEASGTGNMKFMMNGALTIGTMDGANVEMAEMVGRENMFIFGLTADQVTGYYTHGGYSCQDLYNGDSRIRRVVDELLQLGDHPWEKAEFQDLYYSLLASNDEYFVLKDFDAYVEAQELVDLTYRDQRRWLQKVILNIGHSGKFSTDRTIAEYATEIWKLRPYEVN